LGFVSLSFDSAFFPFSLCTARTQHTPTTMHKLLFFFAALLIQNAFSHDMMISPQSRANVEVAGTGCDAPVDLDNDPTTTISQGDSLYIEWKNAHPNPSNTVRETFFLFFLFLFYFILLFFPLKVRISIAPLGEETEEVFGAEENVVATVSYNDVSTTITIPNREPGQYTLQWKWTSYVSCHNLVITEKEDLGTDSATSIAQVSFFAFALMALFF
jgi:hypothetical protein